MIKIDKIPLDFETGIFERFISAKVDDEILLQMDSNPSTGFSWGFVEEPEAIRLEEEKFTLPNQKLLGSAGLYELHYLAQASGKYRLVMEYKQFFAPDAGLIKVVFHFDIKD